MLFHVRVEPVVSTCTLKVGTYYVRIEIIMSNILTPHCFQNDKRGHSVVRRACVNGSLLCAKPGTAGVKRKNVCIACYHRTAIENVEMENIK